MIKFANAKLNIGLHITSKRADGYHNLYSIFYPVYGLHDVIEAVPAQDHKTELTLFAKEIPGKVEDNLCFKAWELLQHHSGIPEVKMALLKYIPIGSGLGGGSSDGAHMLLLLNELFELNLSNQELRTLAAQLGSDCPFFIGNLPQKVSGKGDVFETMDPFLSDCYALIVHPAIHSSTAEAYAAICPKIPGFPWEAVHKELPLNWEHDLTNDFEPALAQKFPVIQQIKEQLYSGGAFYAAMSGSGSAVYGLFREKPEIPPELKSYFYWLGQLDGPK